MLILKNMCADMWIGSVVENKGRQIDVAVNMHSNPNPKNAGSNSGHDVFEEPIPEICKNSRLAVPQGKSTLQYLDHVIRKTNLQNESVPTNSTVTHSKSKKVQMKKLLLQMLEQSQEMLRLSRQMQLQCELFLAPDLVQNSADHS